MKPEEITTAMTDYVDLKSLVNNILDSPGMGGNISVKLDDGSMIIKSSGQDMKEHSNLITRLPGVDTYSVSDDFSFSFSKELKKPSMEWKMHANINAKYVLHYHPIYAMPVLCSEDYPFFENNLPYLNPGKELAEGVKKLVGGDSFSGIIKLQNHGIIIASDSIMDIRKKYKELKDNLFHSEIKKYTPDDVVDSGSYDLWLFNNALENLARKQGITLNEMKPADKEILLQDENEKYRIREKL